MSDMKIKIQDSVLKFKQGNLSENALTLFQTLGYATDRRSPFTEKTFKSFKESYLNGQSGFREEKALVSDWKYVDLLFQLSGEEIEFGAAKQGVLIKKEVKTIGDSTTVIESYLFFTIELSKDHYSRTDLSQITREVNKVFPMPVMIVFKHGTTLSISIINRRLHKRDERRDVLEKVTLIKDISIEKPHRAHIDILFDLSLEELRLRTEFSDFVGLHSAWQKTLNIKELNKKFYKELSNWYFWALQEVDFPGAALHADKNSLFKEEDREKEHNAKNLIRLLTRLLFVWFVKEKGLIPRELFDESYVSNELLLNFRPKKAARVSGHIHSSYYRAVLQNLFFATLNQTMGKREFRKPGQHMNVTNFMRYERYFKDSKKFINLVEQVVPFMNGGLFECLDRPDSEKKGKQGGDVIVYLDGFSDRDDNPLIVPDHIFFGIEDHVDLSEAYGDKAKEYKNAAVKGLINILNSYKFTVAENTPLEEEVALDPELLGQVFENLLASYNPETKTTARKQTGSFYTPREIVNYMGDESLVAYLKQKFEDAGIKDKEDSLRDLISYSENPLSFSAKEAQQLIAAIDSCKILDPACGSGAFPMGILHKLVHILHKLDPHNERWKQKQLEKAQTIDDAEIRDQLISDIEAAFANNELDYGRKLYLIENCIYGVDIQPVATQISKLRFFISLIVDQKVDREKDNLGIRPLPNLEIKFVAANTLIGINRPEGFLRNPKIDELEQQLKNVRHRLFGAKTPPTKRKLREEDKILREKMRDLLISSGWENESARQLAAWDPYDQNTSSPFFDQEWMFGVIDGFDIVIGNPPYIKEYVNRKAFDGLRTSPYYQGKMDIWYLFACESLDMLKSKSGVLAFIAQNNWVTSSGASKMRIKVTQDAKILSLVDFGNYMIFGSDIQTMVMLFRADKLPDQYVFNLRRLRDGEIVFKDILDVLESRDTPKAEYLRPKLNRATYASGETLSFSNSAVEDILNKIADQSNFKLTEKEVANGIHHHHDIVNKDRQQILGDKFKVGDGIFVLSMEEKKSIPFLKNEFELIKPSYTTKELVKYYGNPKNKEWVIYTDSNFKQPAYIKPYPNIKKHLDKFSDVITSDNRPYGLHRSRDERFFKGEKIAAVRKCAAPIFTYTDFDCYVSATFYVIKSERIDLKYLTGLLNSRLIAFWLKNKGKMQGSNYQIDKEPLLALPIKTPSEKQQNAIVELVDEILSLMSKADYATSENKQQKVCDYCDKIDHFVYTLYGLTSEEIKIVQGSKQKNANKSAIMSRERCV